MLRCWLRSGRRLTSLAIIGRTAIGPAERGALLDVEGQRPEGCRSWRLWRWGALDDGMVSRRLDVAAGSSALTAARPTDPSGLVPSESPDTDKVEYGRLKDFRFR